ncbi:MAG: acyl carrier protein [Dehalococcoidales bacterium]|nr:acyl carrier protein [Dehalococcoidales bacterium]
MDEVAEKVRNILVESLTLEPEEVTLESNLRTDLEMDSTEVVELVVALEQDFDIKISDGEITNRQSVGEVVKIVRGKLAK